MFEFGAMMFLILSGIGVMAFGLSYLDYSVNKDKK